MRNGKVISALKPKRKREVVEGKEKMIREEKRKEPGRLQVEIAEISIPLIAVIGIRIKQIHIGLAMWRRVTHRHRGWR
jgi:hypothetical protein